MVTLVQDLNKIGFYICTIDGPRANIDYYGATVDAEARSPSETPKTPDASNVAGPTRPKPKKFVIAKTPDLSGKWEKLDTFGYNLDDPASLVPQEKPSAEAKRVPTEPIQNAAGDSAAIGDAAKRLLEQSDYHISQTNGDREPASLAAEIQWISKTWDCSASRMPYLVYMPEKDRLLMLVTCHKASATIHSDDHGRTWSDRRWLCLDENGQPKTRANALTYLGQGKLLATDDHALWGSSDFGQTWAMCQRMPEAKPLSWWDPVLVVKDSAGGVERLVWASSKSEGPPWGTEEKPYSQGFLQSSTDEGRSWSDPGKVPQWRGTDEIAMTIAKNGDWIAACRTDCPFRLAHLAIGRRHPGKESFDHNDPTYAAAHLATFGRQAGAAHWDHYFGLGVSISKDQGKTWSDLKPLYEWGRHHPSMVVFPDGRIVMTYVVRIGYPDTADGFPQYGVEAVVSSDNGQTWDMEHRYVLAQWAGTLKGEHAYYCAVQSSSTVLLPDGTLLTVFGTGVNSLDTANKKDIAMVRWRLAPAT
jgi:hypothetical protein